MKKYNLKAIIVALLVMLLGIIAAMVDVHYLHTFSQIWVSIGSSLVASALVILLNSFLVDVIKHNPIDDWKIAQIYSKRTEMDADSDATLDKVRHQLDVVAFGLREFRIQHGKQVEACLKRGVAIRIITMDLDSSFLPQREKEEYGSMGELKNAIVQLVDWADKLNQKNYRGKILVCGYSSMTLDFYCRADNKIYVGPYWYGRNGQQTVSYKFIEGGKGFSIYSDYFERLWEDNELLRPLTSTAKKDRKSKKTLGV